MIWKKLLQQAGSKYLLHTVHEAQITPHQFFQEYFIVLNVVACNKRPYWHGTILVTWDIPGG
jgi:hypothetical protein